MKDKHEAYAAFGIPFGTFLGNPVDLERLQPGLTPEQLLAVCANRSLKLTLEFTGGWSNSPEGKTFAGNAAPTRSDVAVFCQKCGEKNKDEDLFCTSCGWAHSPRQSRPASARTISPRR